MQCPSQRTQPALGALDAVGFALWAIGFGIEVAADRQKSAWRELPTSKGRFIDVGLWAWSRHPNYVGMRGCVWIVFS
jgi:steroid 5-alpha reductase family enzyme